MQTTITQLEAIINQYGPFPKDLDEAKASYKPLPGKWSKKELIGHTIDSATK